MKLRVLVPSPGERSAASNAVDGGQLDLELKPSRTRSYCREEQER